MSAHTPTNLIRSFRCSAQEGFCAATVSQASSALERETSHGFIYFEVQPPAKPFQGSIFAKFEVTLDFGLTGFAFPVVYVKFLLPKRLHTPVLSRLCFSLCLGGGGGREVEEMGNQACSRHLINELKSVSEPHCLLAKQNTL